VLQDTQRQCLYCEKTRRRRKRLLCYLGLHNWIAVGTPGDQHLECRHCRKHGGEPGPMTWLGM